MPLNCSQADCGYVTEEVAVNFADMLELLRLHTAACHPSSNPTGTPGRKSQAERVKRPILTLTGKTVEQEEFEHFMYVYVHPV